jgi:ribosome recycling factor
MVKKLGEEAKVGLRNARREANETLKEFTSSGDISEDDERQGLKRVQELTDKFTALADEIVGKKEKEILEV